MPRLSRDVRLLMAELAIPVLLVCAVDRTFEHVVGQSPTAPMPILFPYPISTGKYLAYRQLAAEPESLDVLLMGMSQMMRANVSLLQQAVTTESGTSIHGFNFAAPLQSVEFNRRLLEDVLVPIKAPRVLVHGFVPKNLLYEDTAEQVDATTRSLPVFAMHTGTPAARLQDLLFEHSELLQYREVIRDELLFRPRFPALRPEIWVRQARTTDRVGDVTFMAQRTPGPTLNQAEQAFVAQFANFDGLMDGTRLFEHIGDLARTCRAHGIQLVILNNAVHPLALQELPHGRDDYDRFVAALREAAETIGAPFLDPAPGGIGEPDLFQDTIHHNQAGTRWLSEQIAHFLIERGLIGPATPGETPGERR